MHGTLQFTGHFPFLSGFDTFEQMMSLSCYGWIKVRIRKGGWLATAVSERQRISEKDLGPGSSSANSLLRNFLQYLHIQHKGIIREERRKGFHRRMLWGKSKRQGALCGSEHPIQFSRLLAQRPTELNWTRYSVIWSGNHGRAADE